MTTKKIGQVLACLLLCGATLAQAQNVMTIVSGDKQSVQRSGEQVPGGIANFGAMSVVVKDKAGKPVPGVRVNFQCGPKPNAMACQMDDNSSVGNTDANGVRANTASGIPTARFAPLQVSVKDGAGKPIANATLKLTAGR